MKPIVSIAAMALLCASCFHVNSNWQGGKNSIKGEGEVISKSFDLNDFDSIEINGHADVTFTQSSVYEVTLRTQANIFDYVDFHVVGSTLVLETKDKQNVHATVYDVTIQAPALKSIEVNGAADFKIPSGLRMDGDLMVEVNGSGDLTFDRIQCVNLSVEANGACDVDMTSVEVLKNLAVEVNGAGDVNLHGSAGSASFEVNGAGDIDARQLKVAGEVEKHAAGVARIKL